VGSCALPTIHDTAYPRLKSSISEKELNEIHTPTADEFDLAHSLTNSTAMRIGFLVLLKTLLVELAADILPAASFINCARPINIEPLQNSTTHIPI
jgi:hypothetical protein